MASVMPDAGGGASTGTFRAMRKQQSRPGGFLGLGTGGGKGGQDPSAGLAGRLAGQVSTALGYGQQMEDSRRRAHGAMTERLGEVDQLFAGREPFYGQVHDAALQRGTREAEEWNRDAERQNRFGLLGRGLTGGSADVAVQSRQRQALGDVMGGVRSQARGAARQAEDADMAMRDRMRQGIFAGMPWQGGQQYRPMLGSLPSFDAANRRGWEDVFGMLGRGGMFT